MNLNSTATTASTVYSPINTTSHPLSRASHNTQPTPVPLETLIARMSANLKEEIRDRFVEKIVSFNLYIEISEIKDVFAEIKPLTEGADADAVREIRQLLEKATTSGASDTSVGESDLSPKDKVKSLLKPIYNDAAKIVWKDKISNETVLDLEIGALETELVETLLDSFPLTRVKVLILDASEGHVAAITKLLKNNATITVFDLDLTSGDIRTQPLDLQRLFNTISESSTIKTFQIDINNGPAVIDQFLDLIENNKNLDALAIASCGFEGQHLTQLAKAFEKNDHLTKVTMIGNTVDANAAKAFNTLRRQNTNIQWFEFIDLNAAAGEIGILAEIAQFPTTTRLNLTRNKISKDTATVLANAIKSNPNFQRLNLDGCYIEKGVGELLAQALGSMRCPALVSLNFRINGAIGDNVLAVFAQALQTNHVLQKLKLPLNEKDDAISYYHRAKINFLLGRNSLIQQGMWVNGDFRLQASSVADKFIELFSNTPQEELDFRNTDLNETEIIALIQALDSKRHNFKKLILDKAQLSPIVATNVLGMRNQHLSVCIDHGDRLVSVKVTTTAGQRDVEDVGIERQGVRRGNNV